MVVATNSDRGGRKTHGHEDYPGEAEEQAGKVTVAATIDRGTGFEKVHGKHERGNVALSDPLTMHQTCQIPENMHGFRNNHGKTPWISVSYEVATSGAMSVVGWNCRGFRNPCIVKALQKLVLEEDPTLVFLMETRFVVLEMAHINHQLDRQ